MAKEGEVMSKLKELIDDNIYIWTPAEKIRAAEAEARQRIVQKAHEAIINIDRSLIIDKDDAILKALNAIEQL